MVVACTRVFWQGFVISSNNRRSLSGLTAADQLDQRDVSRVRTPHSETKIPFFLDAQFNYHFIFVHLFVCVCPTMQFLKLQSTHQAVVRQSLCSCQAVVMQSCQAVVMQLSGCYDAVVR